MWGFFCGKTHYLSDWYPEALVQKIKKIDEIKVLTLYVMLSVEVALLLDIGIDNYIHFL